MKFKYLIRYSRFSQSRLVGLGNRTVGVNLVPYMLVRGVFNADNKSNRADKFPPTMSVQIPHAYLALTGCFVRTLLSEPGFSGLSDFQDYSFWTLVAATNAIGAFDVDSSNL